MKGRALCQGVEVESGVRSFPDRISATCGSFVRGSLLRRLGLRARVVEEAPSPGPWASAQNLADREI